MTTERFIQGGVVHLGVKFARRALCGRPLSIGKIGRPPYEYCRACRNRLRELTEIE